MNAHHLPRWLLATLLPLLVLAPLNVRPTTAVAAALTPPTPAWATNVHCADTGKGTTCVYAGTGIFALAQYFTCGDFYVSIAGDFKGTFKDVYDEQGMLILAVKHISHTGTLFNAANPSTTLPREGRYTVTYTYTDGVLTSRAVSGLGEHVIVPGKGRIALAAGRQLFDEHNNVVFEGGPQDIRHGELAELCTALR